MSQVPFTIPIESIDLKELRKRARRLRDEADAAQEEPGDVAETRRRGFTPPAVPTAQPVRTTPPDVVTLTPGQFQDPQFLRDFRSQRPSGKFRLDERPTQTLASTTPAGIAALNVGGTLAEFATDPLDVFSQTVAEIATGKSPTLFDEEGGYAESLNRFRNRPTIQQIGLSFIDPFLVAKAVTIPLRAARTAVRVPLAHAASGAKEVLPTVTNDVVGLRPIKVGLSPTEEISNMVKGLVGRADKNDIATPAMQERSRVRNIIDSQANIVGAKAGERVNRLFTRDGNGGVTGLEGVDPDIIGNPTIQDIAARLPLYEAKLTGEQLDSLRAMGADIAPYQQLRKELGEDLVPRPDVMEGGFYLPRGRASLEGADEPRKVFARRRVGKPASDKLAVFDSQSQGISQGFEYAPIDEALQDYVRSNGNAALDQHISNYFKAVRDASGDLLGETPKLRLLRQNPALEAKHSAILKNLTRLRSLKGMLNKKQQDIIDQFLDDPDFDDIDALSLFLRDVRVRRGPNTGMNIAEISEAIKTVRADVRALAPEWKSALNRARKRPRDQGIIDVPQLANRTFPDEIANAANQVLKERPDLAGPLVAAFNNLYRGFRATLDNSVLGIQGLVGMASDPVAYGQALKVNAQAWGPGGKEALGKFINHFDEIALQTGGINSIEWAKNFLRVGGVNTEFMLGRGVTTFLSRVPVIRQANRAFGFFGDALRLNWADDLLRDELRKGSSLDQIRSSGDLERIAKVVNGATGWSDKRAFGDVGDLLLFAPRFLQSRLETVARAGAGLVPGASIDQRIARNSMLKLIGSGTMLTVSVNELLGQDTDFRPLVNGRYNSNFMRIRFQDRDWSVFGTWDSLARATVLTASGKPQEALRGMGSGVVSNAWDFIQGETFIGEPTGTRPFNAEQFIKRLLENFTPFGAEELPSAGRDIFQGKHAAGTVTILGEVHGFKSSPVTPREARDIARIVALDERGITEEWNDVDRRIQQDVDALGSVTQAKDRMAERQRGRRSKWRDYADERDAESKKYYDHEKGTGIIAELADTYGAGKQFREKLAVHQRDLSIFQDQLKGRSSEALEFFADLEPSKALFNQAREAYFNVISNPQLDNPVTLEYDFELRDELIAALSAPDENGVVLYPPALIAEVQADLHRNDHPLVKELRADRETLRPYWDQIDFVISQQNPRVQKIYRDYQEASPGERTDMTTPLAGDNAAVRNRKERNRLLVNDVHNKIEKWLERARLGPRASSIRAALNRQEYNVNRRLRQIVSVE